MRIRAGWVSAWVTILLAASTARAGVVSRMSLSSTGEQGGGRSGKPALSADGRWVAFISAAPNLTPDDGDTLIDVFVRDRQTGATTLVSKSAAGVKGNANSGYFFNNGAVPALSSTGRYVAFTSNATNLTPEGRPGVFVHDRDADGDGIFDQPGGVATVLMTLSSGGVPGNFGGAGPSISADGRVVSFFSASSNLVPGDTNDAIDVFVHDRDADGDGVFDEAGAINTVRASVGPGGVQADGASFDGDSPTLSADGRIVAFTSHATNLVPNDTNHAQDVFTYDRMTGVTERDNVSAFGVQTVYLDSFHAALSADGRFVAFISGDMLAPSNPAYEPGYYYDVFVHDRVTGATTTWAAVTPISVRTGLVPFAPRLSADGRVVAFTVRATDYYVHNGEALVYVHDRVDETTMAFSIGEGDDFHSAEARELALSADGRAVAFESVDAGFVADDTNGVADTFVHDCPLPVAGQTAFCEPIPLAALDAAGRARFVGGAHEFAVVETPASGLGPVFNDVSCTGCHNRPYVGGSSPRTVTRIGRDGPGGFDDLAAVGGPVIQEQGLPGCLASGEAVPPEATIVARRDTPALFGLGLIDRLSDRSILRRADPNDANHDGISGRANRIGGRVGRFGRKAQIASLAEFAADAYLNEMGVTSPARPDELRPQGMDPVCDGAPEPEDAGGAVTKFTDFITLLAPLQPGYGVRQVKRANRSGARLFRSIGCQACHTADFRVMNATDTGARVRVVLWSDLLLHDMGPGLADGIVQGDATGGEFRTAPLWGVRWSPPYLHDGRAATLIEAIVQHGGEATRARDAFLALPSETRAQVLEFVKSL
jgi:Di-haem oxidoreductase, putative peroxidase/WD40-like Beta Propeller Repeat